MNKLIKLLIIAVIFLAIFILIYSAYSDSQFRYYIGTSTGLKDKPILTNENFMIEEVIVGIQSSTALTFIDDDILFLEKETGQIRHIKNNKLINEPVWDFNVKMEGCECYTESGLLGITSFNSDVYIFVTEELGIDESFVENRIYKFNWKDDQLHNQTLLNILPGYGDMHHGGAMVADLNGNIFAVIGDQDVETELQNVENGIFDDVGIILRVGLTNEIKSKAIILGAKMINKMELVIINFITIIFF